MQNRHFKTDDTSNSRDRDGSGSQNREKKEKAPKKADKKDKKPNDEEADLQRAIEESKKTAEKEERARIATAKH